MDENFENAAILLRHCLHWRFVCQFQTLTHCCLLVRFPEYELRPGGADTAVDSANCAAYVAAVVNATLGAGVSRQVPNSACTRMESTRLAVVQNVLSAACNLGRRGDLQLQSAAASPRQSAMVGYTKRPAAHRLQPASHLQHDPALQVAAFKAGFEEVFPLRHLNAFYEDEIEAVLCGTGARLGPAQL